MTRKVKANPTRTAASQAFRESMGLAPTVGTDARVGCAYGACERRFLPNSSGRYAHTGCEAGSVGFARAYPRGADHMTADAVNAAGPGWVELWTALAS